MMNQKLLTKVLATILATILTCANFIILGVYASNTYATSETLENQTITTQNGEIEFDAYFVDKNERKIHTSKEDFDNKNLNLNLNVNVKKGYLKNAKVNMVDEQGNSTNFKMGNTDSTLETVENIDKDKNTIALKQIDSGIGVNLQIPIESIKDDLFDLSNLSKINRIKLTGEYVNNEGKTKQIEKEILIRVEWTKQVQPVLEETVKTYIPYTIKENSGTILQTVLKAGFENNALPIKQTKVNVNVPVAGDKKPEKVIVTSRKENFNETNYTYNKEKGTLEINVINEAVNNKVSWNKDVQDEYVITYIYNEKMESLTSSQTSNVEIEAYNSVETKVTKANTLNIEEKEIKGNFIEANITATNALSKGYLYTKTQKETIYNEKVEINVGYKDVIDKIIINNNIDNFINGEGQVSPTSISNINYAYYKTVTINKNNLEKILGQDGYIKINNVSGQNIITINKDITPDENGNYLYTFTEETNELQIETSKPISEGKIEINYEKALKGNTDYNKNQVESFQNLQLKALAQASYQDVKISEIEAGKDIALVAPTTKVEASVNKTDLSTIVKNENVEFKAILKTNDITCDLYKNPVVEIVLPQYVESINIKDVNLLYNQELQIKDYNTYVNKNGNTVIKVILAGEDTTYNLDQITKGANIIINTDITLKQLTPTTNDAIKVYVTNELATAYEAPNGVDVALNAVAPVGIVTTNKISGYNSKNESVMSISGEEQTGKLEIGKEEIKATVSMDIINNYDNAISNVQILGRIPFEGNKDVVTGEDLGSNLNTTLTKFNVPEGGTVYFSENGNAGKDLNNKENGWTTNANKNTKSYLVVFGESVMEIGSKISLSYEISIPENLNHNKQTYATYGVYFNNVPKMRMAKAKAVAPKAISDQAAAVKAGLTTGAGPELEVSISNNLENGTAQEGEYIVYMVTVKNVGKNEVTNVKVTGAIPEGTVYTYYEGEEGTEDGVDEINDGNVKEYTYTIPKIAPNSERIVRYIVKADGLENNAERNIQTSAKVQVEGDTSVFTTNTLENKIVEGFINIKLRQDPDGLSNDKFENTEFTYALEIKNPTSKEINNVQVTNVLPEGLTFIGISEGGTYDENSKTALWKFDTINSNDYKMVTIKVKTNKLANEEYKKEITNKMTLTANGKTEEASMNINIVKPALQISQNCNVKTNTISVGEILNYTVTVKNIGGGNANGVVLKDIVPNGLTFEKASYTFNGTTTSSSISGKDETIVILPSLQSGESVEVILTLTANELTNGETEKEVTNVVTVEADSIQAVEANKITHTIVGKGGSITNDPTTGEIQEGTYRITGTAWLDADENGKLDENEEKLAGIKVMLIDSASGKIAKDIVTGQDKVVTTDENGLYVFANIKPGKYIVAYVYDNAKYALTAYKKEGVAETLNSDATSTTLKINNETVNAAATDTIEITNANANNLNIGLIVNKKFDLKLDKTVAKVSVTDSKGTKVNETKNSKLAKIDLNAKTIDTANVVIEYKITVTNEGQVPGYVKKVVDYLPKELTFVSKLNEEWYQAEDGNVYNASLSNTLLNPGETKELTLILTKKMTANSTGNINNVAEIYEASNDLGLKDYDSTPANKVQAEDDISSADVILGIKTGEIYVYILITILSIGILGVGAYLIKKKVLNNM